MKPKNLAVGALVGFLMLALWYNFLLKPTNSKVSTVKADTETERTKLEPLQAQLAQANIDAAHADTFKTRLAVLKHAVPDSPELANFIRDANEIAQGSGLTWQSVTHGPPTAGFGGPSTISIGIQVQGTYEQVLDYLARIAALQRLVVIDSVQFSAAGTTGAGAGGGATESSGPFSGAPTLAVSITARMFEIPQTVPTAVDGTTGTGAAPTPAASGATGSTLNNS